MSEKIGPLGDEFTTPEVVGMFYQREKQLVSLAAEE
jgi:hypothetical protein